MTQEREPERTGEGKSPMPDIPLGPKSASREQPANHAAYEAMESAEEGTHNESFESGEAQSTGGRSAHADEELPEAR